MSGFGSSGGLLIGKLLRGDGSIRFVDLLLRECGSGGILLSLLLRGRNGGIGYEFLLLGDLLACTCGIRCRRLGCNCGEFVLGGARRCICSGVTLSGDGGVDLRLLLLQLASLIGGGTLGRYEWDGHILAVDSDDGRSRILTAACTDGEILQTTGGGRVLRAREIGENLRRCQRLAVRTDRRILATAAATTDDGRILGTVRVGDDLHDTR